MRTHLKGFLYQSLFLLPIFNGLADSDDSVSGFTFWLDYHYSIFFSHSSVSPWRCPFLNLDSHPFSGPEWVRWERRCRMRESLIGSSETGRKDVWDWWRSMEAKLDKVAHAKNCLSEGKRGEKAQWSRGQTGANKRPQKRAEDIIIATIWTQRVKLYIRACALQWKTAWNLVSLARF